LNLQSRSVDVAVVGCGVSGSTAALAAVRNGASVTIFEEHPEVGLPSHCSGHVGILGFNQFGPPIPTNIIENKIKGAILYPPTSKPLRLYRPNPVTWVLNRRKLDEHLAKMATENGANLKLNSRIEGYSRTEDKRIEFKVKGERPDEVTCRVLIDASGCAASISNYAGLTKRGRGLLVNSAQANFENLEDVDKDFVEVYYGQGFAPGFFGWIIPRRDGTAKVGIAAGARANVKHCFDRFVGKHQTVSRKLRHAKRLSTTNFHPIPVGGAVNQTYSDNILAVGDAASQVKATTGGGIVFSLICGKIAGETAARTALQGDASAALLRSYETAWRRILGFDLRAMSWLRRLLYNLPDRNLDRIFSVADELSVDEVLNRTADIDFQGRTMLAMSRDPRLFLTLISASVLSVPSLLRK
jgi:geranylgeranyl reductase family protein